MFGWGMTGGLGRVVRGQRKATAKRKAPGGKTLNPLEVLLGGVLLIEVITHLH
jgi:hypothetical protein